MFQQQRRSRAICAQLASDSALYFLRNWYKKMTNSLAKVYREKRNIYRKVTRLFLLNHSTEVKSSDLYLIDPCRNFVYKERLETRSI